MKKKDPIVRFFQPTFLKIRRLAKVVVGVVLLSSCRTEEPAFVVKGDSVLKKDVKVNVELLKDDGTTMATTFFKGKSYKIPNQRTLRYAIYVSYKDSLFYKFEFDNLHGDIKGDPINEVTIAKEGAALKVWYKPLKQSSPASGMILLPRHMLVDGVGQASTDKDKFTGFYKTDSG
ncbi:hypothetical protein PBAL39_15919 [Pedobacter sp. BAL39]|uniref:hypothetical protein n=1 Tax=Pedobacter sp. BAL39 TaxID=391596 RepID=UPI000155A1CE|nr:hypothetical protein [Pedobacter sp. BAL39]EDM37927.1 hypothetical protein PBAL39_15919 [Pedobacter sp. BAL39]